MATREIVQDVEEQNSWSKRTYAIIAIAFFMDGLEVLGKVSSYFAGVLDRLSF